MIALCLILIAVLWFAPFPLTGPTGQVSFHLHPAYIKGELLSGNLNFHVKQGELVPKDSKVLIEFGEQSAEFDLSELVNNEVIEGDFYAENTDISGSGRLWSYGGEDYLS